MASYKLIKGLGFEEFDRITYGTEDFEVDNKKKDNWYKSLKKSSFYKVL